MNAFINPFSSMLIAFDPERFFGRSLYISQIAQGVSALTPRSFVIHGIKTIGKTSLLKYLCDPKGARARYPHLWPQHDLGDRLKILYLDFYAVEGEAVLPTLYEQLVHLETIREAATRVIPPTGEEVTGPPSPEEAKGRLRQLFRAFHEEKTRLVLCLDHFDSAYRSMKYDDDVFLRSLANLHSFVLATEKKLPELRQDAQRTSPLLNILVPRNLGLLTEAEARELIQTPIQEPDLRFQEAEIAFLLKNAGRQPYLLTIACEFLFDLRFQYPRIRQLLGDPKQNGQKRKIQQQVLTQMEALPTVTDLFVFFWNRLEEPEQELLRKIAANRGRAIDSEKEQLALNSLRQKALIDDNPEDGRPRIFSELFRRYVLRQTPRRRSMEEVAETLAPLDRKLFKYLLARPNQVCTFEELLIAVWGDADVAAHKRKLEAAIHRVRTKIEEINGPGWKYIENVRGEGYRYVPKPQ